MATLEMEPTELISEGGRILAASANLMSNLERIKKAVDDVKNFYQDDEAVKYFNDVEIFYTQAKALLGHVESAGNLFKQVGAAAQSISGGN